VSTTKSIIYVPTSPQFSGECPQPLTAADLHSLLEASQALSRETILADLLKALMPIALRKTGSTFGMLLLLRGEHLSAVARAWAWPDQLDVCLTEMRPRVEQAPLVLLNAALRERRTVLPACIHDADLCAGDTYLLHRAPRSAICTPLLKQGVPIALLYLENAAQASVFTRRRVAFIEMLAVQAAISLDHAQLYQQLQTEKALRRQAEETLRVSEESLAITERGTNGQLAFVGTAMDVSKRKDADEALRSVQSELARVSRISAMGEFAASIAHEVNQPLAAIAMNASAGLNWLKLDPPQLNQVHNVLSTILRASTDAEKLIRSMNNMARRSGPELQRFAVDDAIREVLLLLRAELHEHGIQVCTDFTLAQHQLQAERVQLQQVMMNLFLNAIDAMSGVSCRTRVLKVCSAIADSSATLRISVEDNGRGIDASVAERLFDPLFSTKPAGMGMGLSICRSIVEAHGGRIWTCPRQPQGTTFHVSLPAAGPRN
jgi:C4-dicarboxylate-specific signal transduction histidine kinase